MEQVLEKTDAAIARQQVAEIEDDWELDIKACRLDGHAMMDGELCEACQ